MEVKIEANETPKRKTTARRCPRCGGPARFASGGLRVCSCGWKEKPLEMRKKWKKILEERKKDEMKEKMKLIAMEKKEQERAKKLKEQVEGKKEEVNLNVTSRRARRQKYANLHCVNCIYVQLVH